MAIVIPDKDRVIVEDDGDNLRITMPVVAPPFVPVAVGGLLSAFVWGEISGIIALLNGAPRKGEHFQLLWMTEGISKGPDFASSMLWWLACGAIFCVCLAVIFMWSFAGKEIIELNSKRLKLIRKIPIGSYGRECPVVNIARLRVVPFPWNKQRSFQFFGLGEEAIAFDHGRRTRRVGVSLDEGNAFYVIQEMRKRMKSLGG